MPTNKYNQLIEACNNLETAFNTIWGFMDDPQLSKVIAESKDVFPFDKVRMFSAICDWCDDITANVKKNYLRIPEGGIGYVRYDIVSNDFCYHFDEDEELTAEWIFDEYFNYMRYGTHDEIVESQHETLAEAEKAFSAYTPGGCEINIDKEKHIISGKIYFIQLNEYNSDGEYETDGNVYHVMTGLGYYGMENE